MDTFTPSSIHLIKVQELCRLLAGAAGLSLKKTPTKAKVIPTNICTT